MKDKNKYLLGTLLALCVLMTQTTAFAQDDLYYDPADAPAVTTTNSYQEEPGNVTRRYDNDDDDYYEDDEYAYQYSSRIRRFHRPITVVDYYDPFYVDLYNYDPYFLPGATIYTYGYNDYWTWRRWQRWNRWNNWNSGYDYGWGCNSYRYNSWGWGNPGYNAWNNVYVYNNYYYDPYWTWNGYNPYYNNGWDNSNYYYNNNNNGSNNGGGYQTQTYTGARRNGTNVNPGYARLNSGNGTGRLTTSATPSTKVIDLKSRPNSRLVESQKQPATTRGVPSEKVYKDAAPGSGRPGTVENPRSTEAPSGRNTETTTRRQEKPVETERPQQKERQRYEEPRQPASEPRRNETRRTEEPRTRTESPKEEARPTRRSTESGNRSSGSSNQEARPSRQSSESSGSSRSNTSESRPSRSESSGRSMESGRSSSGSSNSGSSSGSGSRGSSSGSGSSSGGSKGRN